MKSLSQTLLLFLIIFPLTISKHPVLYEISTRPWLYELSKKYSKQITKLRDIPLSELWPFGNKI